jgi:hypothetical protein
MTAKNLTRDELKLLTSQTQALIQKSGSWHQDLLAEIGQVTQGNKLEKAVVHSCSRS